MYIPGVWLECEDGFVRPVLRGQVKSAAGDWVDVSFVLDTGADCTVLTSDVRELIGIEPADDGVRLSGLAGRSDAVLLKTRIVLFRSDGTPIRFKGDYSAVSGPHPDMCLLGRDVLRDFAVIVDRPGNRVCLVRDRHTYRIEPPV
jgi:hypothetical protein